jgi:nucleoid-associated protein YgaU
MGTATDQAQLDQLKQKYSSVLQTMGQVGAKLENLNMQNGKLFMRATAPSQDAANKIWDQIKRVDPGYGDVTADIKALSGGGAAGGEGERNRGGQTYTVKSGDTLSKIAQQYYGDANAYMDIFNANRDKLKDPNKIQPGQELTIPPR